MPMRILLFCNNLPISFMTGNFCHRSQARDLCNCHRHRLGDKRANGITLPPLVSHLCSCWRLPLWCRPEVLVGAVLHPWLMGRKISQPPPILRCRNSEVCSTLSTVAPLITWIALLPSLTHFPLPHQRFLGALPKLTWNLLGLIFCHRVCFWGKSV